MPDLLIKNNLKEVRLSMHLTLNDIAGHLDTSASNVKNMESRDIESSMFFKYVHLLIENGATINRILTNEYE